MRLRQKMKFESSDSLYGADNGWVVGLADKLAGNCDREFHLVSMGPVAQFEKRGHSS